MNIAALHQLFTNRSLNATNGPKQQARDNTTRQLEQTSNENPSEEQKQEAQKIAVRQSHAYRVNISPAALRKMSVPATA